MHYIFNSSQSCIALYGLTFDRLRFQLRFKFYNVRLVLHKFMNVSFKSGIMQYELN
jgi:hypothetical protein